MKSIIRSIVPLRLRTAFWNSVGTLRRRFTTPEDERVRLSMQSVSDGHFHVTYRGVSAIRAPFDYVIYQMILSELRPDLVIEIGTNHGGGALYLADLMELIGTGVVHTIDIVDRAAAPVRTHPRIKRFLGGWQGYDTSEARGYETILIIEDGSHTYEDTLGTLEKFAPLVSLGSYMIVEDGIVSALGRESGFNGGPLRAIREFLPKHLEFAVDRSRCDLFGANATFNVNGYLKRIR